MTVIQRIEKGNITMSELLEKIQKDLHDAMKTEIQSLKEGIEIPPDSFILNQKQVSRFIISMIPELGIKPDKTSDEDIIKLLRKYIKSEQLRLLYRNKYITPLDVHGLSQKEISTLEKIKLNELKNSLTSISIKIANKYLPAKISTEEIKKWIDDNIDFSKFKNKMQAIKPILIHFGSKVDGNEIKKIILEMS